MTTADLFDKEIQNYASRERARFLPYEEDPVPSKDDIVLLVSQLKTWSQRLRELEGMVIGDFTPTVQRSIVESYQDEIKLFEAGKVDIRRQFVQKKVDVKETLNAKVMAAEEALRDYCSNKIQELQPLLRAQAKLRDSREDIEEVFRVYGIPTSNLNIDLRKYSPEEIEQLIKEGSYALHGIIGSGSVLKKGSLLLYWPATIKEDTPNRNIFRASYALAFGVLVYFLKPYFMAIFGLFYIFNSLANLSRINERKKLLQVIYALSDQIDIDRLIRVNPEYLSLNSKLEHLKSLDCDSELAVIEEEEAAALEKYQEGDPRKKLDEELNKWSAFVLSRQYEDAVSHAKYLIAIAQKKCKESYWYAIDEGKKILQTARNEAGFLGEKISEHLTLSHKMRLGVLDYQSEPICEALADLDPRGIYFDNDPSSLEFALLLLSNYLCNIRENYLEVKIVDPAGIGRDFADFRNTETDGIFQCITKDTPKFFETLVNDAILRSQKLGRTTLDAYNADAEAVGKMALKYQLLIIKSDVMTFLQQPQFLPFLEYCHKIGYLVWVFEPLAGELTEEDQKKYDAAKPSILKDMNRYMRGVLTNTSNVGLNSLGPEIRPYLYTSELGRKIAAVLSKTILERKVDAINYETGYREKVIPDDKIWSYNTRNGIELRLGYVDGDPAEPRSITLGDAPVHGLLAGISGSGKSVTFNFIIANLLHMYPPSELKLYMMDFKRVEFKVYTEEYAIPHCELIAGTKDPLYAVSIFQYALSELLRRQSEASKYKLKNIVEYNDYMVQHGRASEKWPRILIIIDEFQEMFNMDDRSIERIKTIIGQLAKLARAFGCHMFFGSQSMIGTVSKDIMDQFQLRVSHYVASDISFQFLGNKAASEIPPRGWCMSSVKGGEPNSPTTLWRIPFISTDQIKSYLLRLKKLCVERNEHDYNAEFYDENEFAGSDKLNQYLESDAVKSDCYATLIGDRTVVSSERGPNYFYFKRDDYENALISAADTKDGYRLCLTFLDNFKSRPNTELICYCCDKDALGILHLEDYLSETALPWLADDISMKDVVAALEQLFEDRLQHGFDKPLYFMLFNFDKSRGICDSTELSLQGRFTHLLERAGKLDVHFIVHMREPNRMERPALNTFNHKISAYVEMSGSVAICSNPDLMKIKEHFCMYMQGQVSWKCKIYDYDIASIPVKKLNL